MSARRPPWLAISGAALAVGLNYLTIFSVPPLITTFVDDLGYSHAQAGALMSVCLGGFLLASLVSGRLAGRFGPVPVMVAGLCLTGVAAVCFGLTDELALWLLCRVAIGIGGGLIYAPGVTFVTSLLPPARANIGVGVFLCGLSIGGTVAYFATRLLSEALGWRWPSFVYGAAVLAGAVVVAAVSGVHAPRGRRLAQWRGATAGALADPTICASSVRACSSRVFVAYGVFTWIPPYLDESAGFSTGPISVTSALMTLAGIPATFGIGLLADRSGRPLAVAAAGLALPLLLVVPALTATPPYAAITVVAAVAALGISGGLGPLYALPPGLFHGPTGATASGLAAASAMGGAVTSTYLGGWIVGASGYRPGVLDLCGGRRGHIVGVASARFAKRQAPRATGQSPRRAVSLRPECDTVGRAVRSRLERPQDDGEGDMRPARTWHHGLIAEWWAEFNTDGPEIGYFGQFVERGQPALDAGCGTGRLLLPWLRAGFDVDGCDVSPDMVFGLPRSRPARRVRTDAARPTPARARSAAPVPDDRRLRLLRPRQHTRSGSGGAAKVPPVAGAGGNAPAGQRGSRTRTSATGTRGRERSANVSLRRGRRPESAGGPATEASTSCAFAPSAPTRSIRRSHSRSAPRSGGASNSSRPRNTRSRCGCTSGTSCS